jgi:hypothetical protein
VTGVKNGSTSAAGRRLLDAAAAAAQSLHAQAAASAAARSKRASQLAKEHNTAKAISSTASATAKSSKPAAGIIKGVKLPGNATDLCTRQCLVPRWLLLQRQAATGGCSSRLVLPSKAYPGAVVSIKVVGGCTCLPHCGVMV